MRARQLQSVDIYLSIFQYFFDNKSENVCCKSKKVFPAGSKTIENKNQRTESPDERICDNKSENVCCKSKKVFPAGSKTIENKNQRAESPDERICEIVLTLHHTIPLLKTLKHMAFENIMGKGENAGNQHFLLFP